LKPEDRRLSAVLAAFVPGRAVELAALVGGDCGPEVRAATEALVRAGRSARLAELARVLTPADPVPAAVECGAAMTGLPARAGRLRQRLRLEAVSAR
jgi:hypothetical protein